MNEDISKDGEKFEEVDFEGHAVLKKKDNWGAFSQ